MAFFSVHQMSRPHEENLTIIKVELQGCVNNGALKKKKLCPPLCKMKKEKLQVIFQ